LATNSKYSHMRIIYRNDRKYFVYGAVQPVKLTQLQEWINARKTDIMWVSDLQTLKVHTTRVSTT
jgi:hypothetical protein